MNLLILILKPPLLDPLHDVLVVDGPDVSPGATQLVVGLHRGECRPLRRVCFL